MSKLSKHSSKSNKSQEMKLVEIHGNKLTTTSIVIAELFNRTHGNVIKSLEKLKDRIHLEPISYKDSYGRNQKAYELDERSFLIAMPFIGGAKAEDGQVKLVDEFLRLHKLQNQPGRKEAIKERKESHAPMQAVKQAVLENEGLPIHRGEFIKENYFCNRALTGKWESLEGVPLDTYDNKLLTAIRLKNIMLMVKYGKKQDKRKELLDNFVEEYRAKNPKQNKIQEPSATYQLSNA